MFQSISKTVFAVEHGVGWWITHTQIRLFGIIPVWKATTTRQHRKDQHHD